LGEDVRGLDDLSAAEKAINRIEKLRAEIGIPLCLRDLGVKREQLPGFAKKAFGIRRITRVNPRAATIADLEGILESAF
jgi:alcohol dehydrogenase